MDRIVLGDRPWFALHSMRGVAFIKLNDSCQDRVAFALSERVISGLSSFLGRHRKQWHGSNISRR